MKDQLSIALAEVKAALSGIEQDDVDAACRIIASGQSIGLYGCGREGYQMRGFAMRLFHLEFNVGYLGDTTMPPLGEGDLLIVSSGPGNLSTVNAHMETARTAGVTIILVTAQLDAQQTGVADLILTVPAQTMANDSRWDENDILPMGSVYEAALFFLFEWMVANLKTITGETAETMRARHTNME